jgi:tetratricopeptide (TPR) repeat protein
MKHKLFLAILLICCSMLIFPNTNPWGNLKKIHFYDSLNAHDKVQEQLELIRFEGLSRADQKEVAGHLVKLGDNYFLKNQYQLAGAFYRKVLAHSSDYWYLYNKLEKIERENGSIFIGFKNSFKQLFMMLKNFKASFLFFNSIFNILFFASMMVFFLFALLIFIKYFKLAGNDLVILKDGQLSILKMGILTAILLWPLLLLSGWMIYPFVIIGFLWLYMNDNEKAAVKTVLIVVAVMTLLYSINLVLERSLKAESFKKVRNIYAGHLFDKNDYQTFDNELKVALALSYYEKGDHDTAEDILNSTGESYDSVLKNNLLGNIYYRYGELDQCMAYYRKALKKDPANPVTLNNFTLALLKDNKPKAIIGYANAYPEIADYRNKPLKLKEVKLQQGVLWKRLFNFSEQHFSIGAFLGAVLGQLMGLPILYFIGIFILYLVGLQKITPTLGESTYCSKCAKIIKEASIHRSYKLCDECHQLFSIKDVIFLEAKILKEKELKKRFRKHYLFSLIFSVLMPGLVFNNRENNRLFLVLNGVFYFLLGEAIITALNFSKIYTATPLILNYVGILAFLLYVCINIFSVLGDEDGI